MNARAVVDRSPEAFDNLRMPSTKASSKRAPRKTAKSSRRTSSHAALLKLATASRPPQEWYADQADPT